MTLVDPTPAPSHPHAAVAPLGTVVGVWAHPDDEAYLSAGLMAAAVDLGARVACVTATRGERGTDDPETWPPRRLARLRERELAASLAVLGVTTHRWLGLADGGVASIPDALGTRIVGRVLDALQPDTVVTFGADGMTGHPDHVAIGRWATVVARAAGARVLHATTTASWADAFSAVHERFGVFGPAGPPRADDADLALALELDGPLLERKVAALRAQASQTSALAEAMGHEVYRRWWARECFTAG